MKKKPSPGAALAACRRRTVKTCVGDDCDKQFEGIATAKYCSNRCKQRAKHQRSKKGKPNE